ncbi:MAG: exopolyphosphatase [Phycisphaeraceae bacterium]|nr:exopolyphosphatase [Phycisphaeraceae bacterium]
MTNGKYRLLTRSDFDGLVCAVLLKEAGLIDLDITFVHPKDVQDGKVEVTDRDILTNLPYVPGCHLCFDHHHSEGLRKVGEGASNHILVAEADSAARVVYDHLGGVARFANIGDDMMEAVDKADSARFNLEEVLEPTGWALRSFIMDARTGLGRFRDFHISNYQLMMDLIGRCQQMTIEEIMTLPDVHERVALYQEHQGPLKDQIDRCTTVHGKLVELDLREEQTIYCGNRFMIYALYPQCNVSMHVIWGLKKQNTVFAIGRSIFDRACPVDVGALCLQFGGGGHEAAGTCQVANDEAERARNELISQLAQTADRSAA